MTDPDTTEIICTKCKTASRINRDVLRNLLDADKAPPCPECEKRAAHRAACQAASRVARRAGQPLTTVDLVLVAANRLAAPFAHTALVIPVWTSAPARFGLPGHTNVHPDSHKIYTALAHAVRLGFLAHAGRCLYRLTAGGQARIKTFPAAVRNKPAARSTCP